MVGINIFDRSMPKDLLFQIFLELPVKSLSRFKCVSKQWCALIEDPQFVDSHRLRSHARSGGIRLLGLRLRVPQAENGPPVLFLLDPEGDSEPVRIPVPPTFFCNTTGRISRSVEGLVCFGSFIWNPSTKEAIKLPDQDWRSITCPAVYGDYNIKNEYVLGFDAPSKMYKVLSFCRISFSEREFTGLEKRDSQGQVVTRVLTLGTNSWRVVDCNSDVVHPGIRIEASLSVDNKIFLLVSPRGNNNYLRRRDFKCALLIFEVGQEKFRIISLPDGQTIVDFVLEVSGRFAMIDQQNVKTICILQDYENEKWIKRNIQLPGYWTVDQRINSAPSRLHSAISVTPIGTIHTREILFEARKPPWGPVAFYFYYNSATRNVREIPKHRLSVEHGDDIMFFKHVETIFPLKQYNT